MNTIYKDTIIQELSDQEIVEAILKRDKNVTVFILYQKYYPLFNAIFNKYYTDCENTIEFINQIYVLILTPGKISHKAPLSTFNYRCSLGIWLKLVAENYCKQSFKKKLNKDDSLIEGDRKTICQTSPNIDSLNKHDIDVVLQNMRNRRYREIIRIRYLEEKSNEETAILLGMTMDNYYNKHKLAKEQLVNELRKEGLL